MSRSRSGATIVVVGRYLDGPQLRLSRSLLLSSWNIFRYAYSSPIIEDDKFTVLCTEGLNGRLPNQDLLNSFQRISRYSGGVPVTIYDHIDPREYPSQSGPDSIPSWVSSLVGAAPGVQTYAYQATNILRHVGYQARGRASGVHGLLHQYILFV
jgi:hypothetical protein